MSKIKAPTVGEIVLYRTDGRNGLVYDLPAIVTCTKKSHPGNYPDGKKNPLPVPESRWHVHLTVFTPGGYGTVLTHEDQGEYRKPYNSKDFVGALELVPGSGTYVEWNVPVSLYEKGDDMNIEPRSWRHLKDA